MSVELRIKLQHIGMEPSIIKKHEKRIKRKLEYLKNSQSNSDPSGFEKTRRKLIHHRRWDVRNEIRATGLALAFIRGTDYNVLEQKVKEFYKRKYYIIPKVVRMIKKYHPDKDFTDNEKAVYEAVNKWIGIEN